MKLCTTKELAEVFLVHPKTIVKWARCGILPVIRINRRVIRFDQEKCSEAINRRTRLIGGCFPTLLVAVLIADIFACAFVSNLSVKSFVRLNRSFVMSGSSVQIRQAALLFLQLNHCISSVLRFLKRCSLWEEKGALAC